MEENQANPTQEKQENVKKEFKSFTVSIKEFFLDLLDIREGTDKKETIQKIKDGIPVKNHTAWILVFSIIIASIGLNVSSTAVVIGAMLVSPLMGPILGIGLSIGINDIDTMKRSLINLGVMIALSVVTSFLFFSIPLFQELTPELMARTKPDVRDVLIATAGGFALIIALSRHREITNAIAGIAIATALMPPLCTAGYGLAVGNISYFGGAMFLFIINAVFIALATFVIVKFLRFPMVKYINSAKRKRIAQLASILALIIFSFSIYQFYQLFQENNYNQNCELFIKDLKEKTGAGIIDQDFDYKKSDIDLVILGNNLTEQQKIEWEGKLTEYNLEGRKLNIKQDEEDLELLDKVKSIEDLYVKNQKLIASKEESLQEKDIKIQELSLALEKLTSEQIPFLQVSKEAKINYEGLKTISFSKVLVTNFESIDTIPVASIRWYDSIAEEKRTQAKLAIWLKTRLNLDTLVVKEE
ncbi:DUF389 domain-containing protein [Pseudotenacibaculum sp. MALMAid0570]|uniref:DUF389 domain-containing protein n=1 Tax=Pseudotenacibaculum sp. MALMAid0570 TaxID=3143938 RepID=UPI0032DF86FE